MGFHTWPSRHFTSLYTYFCVGLFLFFLALFFLACCCELAYLHCYHFSGSCNESFRKRWGKKMLSVGKHRSADKQNRFTDFKSCRPKILSDLLFFCSSLSRSHSLLGSGFSGAEIDTKIKTKH